MKRQRKKSQSNSSHPKTGVKAVKGTSGEDGCLQSNVGHGESETTVLCPTGIPHLHLFAEHARWWLFAAMIFGLILRVYRLSYCDLHNDEALQLNGIMTTSWDALIRHITSVDIHPPFSYLCQKAAARFSLEIWALRGVSVLVGMLAIFLSYWVFLPLWGKGAGVVAAWLSATSYYLVWYSRELRGYIFFYAFFLWTLGHFVRILTSRNASVPWRHYLGFSVSTILGAYSHYNTWLTWPIYGLIFFVWEWANRSGKFRWTYLIAFGVSGGLVLTAISPSVRWLLAMQDVVAMNRNRPDIATMYSVLTSFGLGSGWRNYVWAAMMVMGALLGWKMDIRSCLMGLIWLIAPVIIYVYGIGMSDKFVNLYFRYVAFGYWGVVCLSVLSIIGVAHFVPTFRNKGHVVALTAVALIMVLDLRAFSQYYRMRSYDFNRSVMGEHLESLGPRCMLLDNYYDMQQFRHYLPSNIVVAHPPVWNNPDEYRALSVSDFIRHELSNDPFLVLKETGSYRGHATSCMDTNWLGGHFSHSVNFPNEPAYRLFRMNKNFATISHHKDYFTRWLHYNDRDSLPEWYRARGIEAGVAFGGEFYAMLMYDTEGKPFLARIAAERATLLVVNSSEQAMEGEVSLAVQGCHPEQVLTIENTGNTLGRRVHRSLPSRPFNGIDLRSESAFRQHVPFGTLIQDHNGLLYIPLAWQPDWTTVYFGRVVVQPGVTIMTLTSNRPEGFFATEPRIKSVQPGTGNGEEAK